MKEYIKLGQEFLNKANADALAISIIDFKKNEFDFFEIYKNEVFNKSSKVFFDLASLTKPLTNSFYAIKENVNDEKLISVLNHSGSLPAWGLLGSDWKQQILNYKITPSDTLYSDFSALRFMLEVGDNFKNKVFENLDSEIYFWKELPSTKLTVQNGYVNRKPNFRCVHDPNAYNLNCFTSHAGLFGSVEALSRTLLGFNQKTDFIQRVASQIDGKSRFVYGFDTVQNTSNTLAGRGCSSRTFGHLGFTGTSFWIDEKQMKGHVILSNSTKYFWFDKVQLNRLRREVGERVWQS